MAEPSAPARKRILVVDDELAFCEMIKLTLEVTGMYRVRSLAFSSQVVAVARDYRPDLILLDCMMPGMDGGQAMGALEADALLRDVPVAFLTATVAEPERSASRCYSGERTYLPKTLPLKDLVAFIEAQTTRAPAAGAAPA